MAELGVFGIGVATADPELRMVGQKNTPVCTVNLAFNRSFQQGQGQDREWKTEACFLRAQVWGARAEKMAELVKKGQPIYVCGYMKQDSWEKDGQKRVSYSITLRDFQLCVKNGKKSDKKKADQQPEGATAAPAGQPDCSDEDIPF